MILNKTFFIALLVLTSMNLWAQRGFELGGNIGTAMYFGDINNEFSLNSPGVAAGVAVRYNFDERINTKVGVNYLLLRGYDYKSPNIFQQARNISFNNHMAELSAQIEVNFLTYKHGSRDQWYTPYMFLGGSVFTHQPTTKYQGAWYKLRPLGTEGQLPGDEYSLISGSWLYGMGMKVDISYSWSLNFELTGRQTFTDYIDDTSTNYVDRLQLISDRGVLAADIADPSIFIPGYNDFKLGEGGRQRGDSDAKDSFGTFTIGLMYYFGQVRCPDILKF